MEVLQQTSAAAVAGEDEESFYSDGSSTKVPVKVCLLTVFSSCVGINRFHSPQANEGI